MKTETRESVAIETKAMNMARTVQGALKHKGELLPQFRTLLAYTSHCVAEQAKRDWQAAQLAMQEQHAMSIKEYGLAQEPYQVDVCQTVGQTATSS